MRPLTKPPATPTVDEYFTAAHKLAALLRKAFDHPGSVKRPELLTALERFEQVDYHAM